ncbi:UNVERIFIED_CONTAM: Retrovirus-related Pol polyprotein from transposon RE1 [Sesamum radiatum]|uniref:Retrovirus-related Pol polyprotein from transposon RE1 n=1 Tax=Sesamum radiatum TaxID=300843 RepID=A0AAW2PFU6_SESRA
MTEVQQDFSTANASNNRSHREMESFQPVESTGSPLISSTLTGDNYLVWCRAVRFALGSRKKLSFIDGRAIRPADDSDELDEWIRIDYMVITWILNSVSKNIVDAFMYSTSARSLWLELEARYGGSNGPMIYNLEREVASITQGQKAYKLFDINTQTYLISRDVIFYEDVFPFANTCSSQHRCPLPLPFDAVDIPASPQISHSAPPHISPAPNSQFSDIHSSPDSPAVPSNAPVLPPLPDTLPVRSLLEPHSYKQAVLRPEWVHAMQQELSALEKNQTWEVTSLPQGKKPIGCKWVYKLKLKDDGSVERCKARLVAKGFSQVEGVDYVDVFSPVAKAVTVRLFLAISSAFSWPLHQLDVNNAFLHGYLDEEIYMLPPEGYSTQPGEVCKLKRSLYGLKQASRQWNQELSSKLISFGFSQSAHDHCLFVRGTGDDFIALLVYVDDVLLTSPSSQLIVDVKSYLDQLFTIKDLGLARYFLGLQIARSSKGTSLNQAKYIQDLILDSGLSAAKAASTPLPQNLKLSAMGGAALSDPEPYRRLVGRLLYLGFTRPDISYSVQQLSQFLQKPCSDHWNAALHVVRYLKGTASTGIFFPASNSFQLQAYCDADWASCLDSRKSVTGFCVFLGDALISWKTKKQATVSRSSAEAEYRSMGTTVCELQWISYLLHDFGIPVHTPISMFCDNKAALHIMANPVFHERTKHLDIDCHIVRNQYKLGFIAPSFVRSKEQVADLFTKSLPGPLFLTLLSKLKLFALFLLQLVGDFHFPSQLEADFIDPSEDVPFLVEGGKTRT